MRFYVIACEVLARPLYAGAARSPHTVDIALLEKGLHNTPVKLHQELQDRIDAVPPERYDYVILGYGLCGDSTAGLRARDVPLVIPRAHDCITLYLGSRARYMKEFHACPGTYYYCADYMERGDHDDLLTMGVGQEVNSGRYQELVERYGEENARYLMETMGNWMEHYSRGVFIDMPFCPVEAFLERAREEVGGRGWNFEVTEGDDNLLRRMVAGDWDDDFLIVLPGETIKPSYRDDVVQAVPGDG